MISLRFRAPDRTLKDAEVAATRDAAVAEAGAYPSMDALSWYIPAGSSIAN